MMSAGLSPKKIEGRRELLKRVVPPWKPSHVAETKNPCSYNANTFRDLLDDPKCVVRQFLVIPYLYINRWNSALNKKSSCD